MSQVPIIWMCQSQCATFTQGIVRISSSLDSSNGSKLHARLRLQALHLVEVVKLFRCIALKAVRVMFVLGLSGYAPRCNSYTPVMALIELQATSCKGLTPHRSGTKVIMVPALRAERERHLEQHDQIKHWTIQASISESLSVMTHIITYERCHTVCHVRLRSVE